MESNIAMGLFSFTGLLEKIVDEVSAGERRKHEQKMKQLSIIENSSFRDEYVRQMLLDRFLAPIERAQHKIQETAMHANWLAEMINYHYPKHGLDQTQARELSTQLRYLAAEITHSESLHDLKFIYAVITRFADEVSRFRHKEREYSLERSIRRKILNPLNSCIATQRNFHLRIELMTSSSEFLLAAAQDNTKHRS